MKPMMQWVVALGLFVALGAGSSPALARNIEDELESRWLGAWVLTGVETYSDCAGLYTGNRVNGRLVSGRGRNRFKPGELAKVEKVDAKRSRLDLHLSLEAPLLAQRQDGPFTLYDEAGCRMELQIELPRKLVSDDNVRGIEQLLAPVLARFDTADAAQSSKSWNRRKMAAYPRDYDRTLAEYAAWKAEQTNAAVQAKLERARDEAARVTERLTSDADYLAGFARGLEAARAVRVGGCSDLLGRDVRATAAAFPQQSSSGHQPQGNQPPNHQPPGQARKSDGQGSWSRGNLDGQTLFFSLDQLRRLPDCFVEVPEPPAGPASTASRR